MSKFFPMTGFKWLVPKKFDLNKYTSNSSKGRVLEIDLEYPEELRELHTDYHLAPDKTEIKREMSDNQLKNYEHHNILIDNVRKLVPIFFMKKKNLL